VDVPKTGIAVMPRLNSGGGIRGCGGFEAGEQGVRGHRESSIFLWAVRKRKSDPPSVGLRGIVAELYPVSQIPFSPVTVRPSQFDLQGDETRSGRLPRRSPPLPT